VRLVANALGTLYYPVCVCGGGGGGREGKATHGSVLSNPALGI